MAPKKTTLLLAAALLFTGLASANTIEGLEDDQEVWLNDGADQKIQFNVTFSDECLEDTRTVRVDRPDGVTEFSIEDSQYNFSTFSHSGTYTVNVECVEEVEDGEDKERSVSHEVEAGLLALDVNGVPSETLYEGESFEVSTELSSDNGDMVIPDAEYEYRFGEEEWSSLGSEDGSIEVDSSEIEVVEVRAVVEDFSIDYSEAVDVQDVWQIEGLVLTADDDISDNTVKYRHLDQLKLEFKVTERGEGAPGLRTDEFLFDGEDDWFDKEDLGNGDYRLNIDGRPVYSDLAVEDPVNVDIRLDNSREDIESKVDIVDLRIEEDVEFSGRVLNVRNNRVDTEFLIEHDGRVRAFETDDNGVFEQYIETDIVDMQMDFPEARVNLDSMQVDREDAGGLSYNYYDDVEESLDTSDIPNVRPVNLAAFISNYHFDEGIDSNIRMEFDTSEIDPDQIEVYECVEWTFRSESCDGEWNIIEENDVGLTPGATWKADFPITPRESERFGHDDGVLTNAYLIGVPEGVGSGLTLQSSLDVSSNRIEAEDELTVSGTIIDDSTGNGVGDVDVTLELIGDNNDYSFETTTGSNGEFSFEESISDADEYSVRLTAEKSPYDSFEREQSSAIEVYYDVGLEVTSSAQPTITMGEDAVIEYEAENTGQTDIEDIEVTVSGLDSNEYSLESSLDSLESGETADLVLTYFVPEDLNTPPSIEVEVSGTADGETVENSATVHTQIERVVEETNETDEPEEEEVSESSFVDFPDTEGLQTATGEFIESQSDMNLALGLMLVFAMILAVAVRQKNSSDSDRMGRSRGRMGENSRVQKPSVAPQKVEPGEVDEESGEDSGSEEVESKESEEDEDDEGKSDETDDGENVCDVCGEEFDTASGLDLHKQALHD